MPRATHPVIATPPIPSVNIGWIHPFLEILDETGTPSDRILEEADLPVLAVEDKTALVPTSKIYQLVALAQQATGLDDLGFRAAQRLDIEAMLPDAERAWMRPGAFRSLEGFINVALESSSSLDMWIESKHDPIKTTELFYLGTFGPDHPAFSVVEQFMVVLMVRWTRYGAESAWNPERLNFRATSVPQDAVHNLAGNAEVRTTQNVTSIVFPSQQFIGPMQDLPRKGSNIWRRHRRSLERSDQLEHLSGSLRLVLPAYLPDGSPGIDVAAKLTGTSIRTLQRRLEDEGTTYSQLLEGLRHDLAVYHMRDPDRTASAISRELGYQDPAIFTRAFRRWTGQTPSQYRASLGA